MVNLFRFTLLVPLPLILGLIFSPFLGTGAFNIDFISPTPAALTFLVYIGVLGIFVHKFAWKNLHGDPHRNQFMANLTLTLWAVQGLAIAGNFLIFLIFWFLTSLGVHRLLQHFNNRPGARIVVWEKFIISRAGDLALVAAGVLLAWGHGSLNFSNMALETSGVDLAAALLIVMGALTKSAQVPFHSWLPRTLEAPTAVSALLHAGVINAGGFLLIRFFFLLESQETALAVLIFFGGLSALWGGFTMLVQGDIKRRLAWSTVGQMGFMMIEIGLGSPGLALIHLMGHGFYKSRAFLWSSDLGQIKIPPAPVGNRVTAPLVGLGVWILVGLGFAYGLHIYLPGHLPLGAVAWAVLLPLVVGGWERPGQKLKSLTLALGALGGSTVISLATAHFLGLSEALPLEGIRSWEGYALGILFGLFGLMALFPLFSGRFRIYRFAYASALHGFGFGRWPETILNRITTKNPLVKKGAIK